jgi:Zn-dependent protease
MLKSTTTEFMTSELPAAPQPEPPDSDLVPVRTVPADQVFILDSPETGAVRSPAPFQEGRMPRSRLALILFLLTCLCTFLTGFFGVGVPLVSIDEPLGSPILLLPLALLSQDIFRQLAISLPARAIDGLVYSGSVMAILGAHELGHYFQARRNRVPASLPMFIPFPINPFGTMGAVIFQQSGVANRKSMFDIAISGPLAGLVISLPVAYYGILESRVVEITQPGAAFGDPLLLKWMYAAVHGPIPAGSDVTLNPLLFAGWVGVFITALNLIPIGQLDGGHILYCLIGQRAHFVARALFWGAAAIVAYSVIFGSGQFVVWSLMLFLIWMFGTRHPPTANDRMALGPVRVVLGWLTLMFVFIGLTPTPMYIHEGKPPQRSVPVERDPGTEIRI